MAISTRLKANSRNIYLCGSELGISKVQNDYQIKIGSHLFEIFAGEKIARSTGTTNPHTAQKIAIELTQIVRSENTELWAKKVERKTNPAPIPIEVSYEVGDPANIDNWTMGDALIYKSRLPDTSPDQKFQYEKDAQRLYFETGNSGLPEKFGDWPLMTDETLTVYKKYRWLNKVTPWGKPHKDGTKTIELSRIRTATIIATHLSATKGNGKYHKPNIVITKPNNRREEFLDIEEANRMFEFIRSERPYILNLYICLVFLGARPIELARLQWEDVRLDHKDPSRTTVKLWSRKGAGKIKRTRRVACHQFVHEALCRQLIQKSTKDDYVFRTQFDKPWGIVSEASGKGKVPGFTRHFSWIRKELNFNHKLVCYSMRHTFGSWLAQNDISVVTIKDLMGHADIGTTMNYIHVADKNKINAVQGLGKEKQSQV